MTDTLTSLALIVLYLGFMVFWVMMLINAAKTQQWGWFVAILLFGFVALIYRFTNYQSPGQIAERKRRRRRTQESATRQRDERIAQLEGEVERLKTPE